MVAFSFITKPIIYCKMNIEELRDYCLSKKYVEESFPFGEDTLVFKIMGKVFLLVSINSQPLQFNVKCEPEKAIELREQFTNVLPGYHMNKKHWNTIICDGTTNHHQLKEWIDESYSLVYESLPLKIKKELNAI
jgi:predicted DNA-binding protein (MmcQ/YjbR family)